MSRLVTIYGGSGFVGRYIAQRMARAGWTVRVAVRRPNQALFVRPYGAPGQVEPVLCNIRDEASVRAAMQGADAVVNCVGVLNSLGKNTFDAVHVDGAGRIARLAAELGVQQLVHLSALGADADGASDYARTKARGEAAVLAAFPAAVILRPSVIFGTEDGLFNRFAGMVRSLPLVPVVAAETRIQPVWVEDVAQAAAAAVQGRAAPGVYELGGPDVMTIRQIHDKIAHETRRKRVFLPLPGFVAGLVALGFDILQGLTLGLVKNGVLTRDQLRSLSRDSVAEGGRPGLEALGISPTAVDAVIPDYLWRFRPTGQYAAIKESAKKLNA